MSAEELYLNEIEWQKRRPPATNRRPAPLPLARGEAYPHYQLDELADGRRIIAPVLTLPTLIRGRVIAAERDRDESLGSHVVHVGLALAGLASWPVLWRLDPSRIEYQDQFRLLTTPGAAGYVTDSLIETGVRKIWRSLLSSERLHVHLVDAWREEDERLLLQPGQRIEVYGPVCALAVAEPDSGACEILFSEVDPPECWCIYPLRIDAV